MAALFKPEVERCQEYWLIRCQLIENDAVLHNSLKYTGGKLTKRAEELMSERSELEQKIEFHINHCLKCKDWKSMSVTEE